MAMEASDQIYACRERAAAFFGLQNPAQVVFTLNCTHALNTIIKSLLADGGRAVVSDLEHNAVMRPLHALSPYCPIYDTAHVTIGNDDKTVQAFEQAITPHTRAVICTHASNVFGAVLPIGRIAQVAHRHGVPIVVDAAQSAGVLPIDMLRDELDYVCAAGHKGLYGPMGTGLLLCGDDRPIRPLTEGGTGSNSLHLSQPDELPDRLESGTPNVAGICGLSAALLWLQERQKGIAEHETALAAQLYDALSSMHCVTLYTPRPALQKSTGVVSATFETIGPEAMAAALDSHGIAVRAGLHCAPSAHRTLGTLPGGTVRFSVGAFTTRRQMAICIQIIKKIMTNPLLFA